MDEFARNQNYRIAPKTIGTVTNINCFHPLWEDCRITPDADWAIVDRRAYGQVQTRSGHLGSKGHLRIFKVQSQNINTLELIFISKVPCTTLTISHPKNKIFQLTN